MCPASGDNAIEGGLHGLAGVRVLVVEDAWHVAKALQSALEDLGMRVAGPAARVADAERLLDNEVPDLAVVDVNLKGEMAYGLIDRLHERGVRVIVVSGYAVLPSSLDKAAAILQKPFSGAALLATLQKVVKAGKSR
jgi:DNA-binding response OmpR family regulator